MEGKPAEDGGIDTTNFDNEVLAYLSVRKEELIESHEEYIMSHPEIREVLNDFLSSVLAAKPVSAKIPQFECHYCNFFQI